MMVLIAEILTIMGPCKNAIVYYTTYQAGTKENLVAFRHFENWQQSNIFHQ